VFLPLCSSRWFDNSYELWICRKLLWWNLIRRAYNFLKDWVKSRKYQDSLCPVTGRSWHFPSSWHFPNTSQKCNRKPATLRSFLMHSFLYELDYYLTNMPQLFCSVCIAGCRCVMDIQSGPLGWVALPVFVICEETFWYALLKYGWRCLQQRTALRCIFLQNGC